MLSVPTASIDATVNQFAHDFVFASFVRTIELARIENKRAIFRLLARDARQRLDRQFQTTVDELFDLAEDSGLLEIFGPVTLQDDFAASFGGQR